MMIAFLRGIAVNRKGGTAVEYGLILALVVISMLGALIGVANTTTDMWTNVNTKVATATGN